MPLFQSRLFLRIIFKNKEAYVLKIITLTVAFWCSILVILFALNEFGYDRFSKDSDSVFRVIQRNSSETYYGNRLSNKIPAEVFRTISLIHKDSLIVSRIKVMNEVSIITAKQTVHDQKIHAADPQLATIFSFDILAGSLDEFKNGEKTIILSSSAAVQYTGDVHAIGKKLKIYTIGDTLELTISAVFNDFPQNTHEEFNVFMRYDSSAIQMLGFSTNAEGIYGRVLRGSYLDYEAAINDLIELNDLTYKFQPLPQIYFGPRVLGEEVRHGDSYSVLILISVTSLILFLALSSFINLTMLTLPHRSKELAVKKLAGVGQWNLILAFTKESFAIVGCSLMLGIILLLFTSDLIAPALSIDLLSLIKNGNSLLYLITAALFIVLTVAPVVMTLRLTRATPTRLLSTESITFPRIKRTITFLQLGISIFLIVSAMVIRRQINRSLIKEPGRNYDQVVYLDFPRGLTNERLQEMRANWKRNNPNILDVMGTSQLPDNINSKELNSPYYLVRADPGFRDFFGLNMLEGKWFGANNNKEDIVINEKGKELITSDFHVLGVIDDVSTLFNQPEKPLKLQIDRNGNYNFLCIRILEIEIRRTIGYLADAFDTPKADIRFLNESFENWLRYQDRLNSLSDLLTIISGLLSCLAIYGLSVTLVRDKLRQIAIHKLCGASTINITRLLVNEFVRQMLLAIVIFGPITYILIREMLRSFVYATHFQWLDSVIPLAYCAIVIVLLCAFQAMSLNRKDLTSSLKG